MVDEEVYRLLERDLHEERTRLKRKLCDADFESVESLKGLDITSDNSMEGSSAESIDKSNVFSMGLAEGGVARSAPVPRSQHYPHWGSSGHPRKKFEVRVRYCTG